MYQNKILYVHKQYKLSCVFEPKISDRLGDYLGLFFKILFNDPLDIFDKEDD